jgi:hypothetical protein
MACLKACCSQRITSGELFQLMKEDKSIEVMNTVAMPIRQEKTA